MRSHGVGIAIQGILRLKPGGHLWLAPACSHWAYMCSSQHGRTRAHTNGNTSWLPVELANTQSMILAMLTVIAWLRHIHIYYGQARSSLLYRHLGSFWFLWRILDVKQGVVGKRFGFSSVKPLSLRSTNP